MRMLYLLQYVSKTTFASAIFNISCMKVLKLYLGSPEQAVLVLSSLTAACEHCRHSWDRQAPAWVCSPGQTAVLQAHPPMYRWSSLGSSSTWSAKREEGREEQKHHCVLTNKSKRHHHVLYAKIWTWILAAICRCVWGVLGSWELWFSGQKSSVDYVDNSPWTDSKCQFTDPEPWVNLKSARTVTSTQRCVTFQITLTIIEYCLSEVYSRKEWASVRPGFFMIITATWIWALYFPPVWAHVYVLEGQKCYTICHVCGQFSLDWKRHSVLNIVPKLIILPKIDIRPSDNNFTRLSFSFLYLLMDLLDVNMVLIIKNNIGAEGFLIGVFWIHPFPHRSRASPRPASPRWGGPASSGWQSPGTLAPGVPSAEGGPQGRI